MDLFVLFILFAPQEGYEGQLSLKRMQASRVWDTAGQRVWRNNFRAGKVPKYVA